MMHKLADIAKALNRSAVYLQGLQKRFDLPILKGANYSGSYLLFLQTVISLRTLNISEETILELWRIEQTPPAPARRVDPQPSALAGPAPPPPSAVNRIPSGSVKRINAAPARTFNPDGRGSRSQRCSRLTSPGRTPACRRPACCKPSPAVPDPESSSARSSESAPYVRATLP